MLTNTISQEVIAIRAKTKLVPIIKEYVQTMRELWPDWPKNTNRFNYGDKPWKDATTKFVKAIRAATGIKLSIDVVGNAGSYDAGVYTIAFNGHSGTRWTKEDKKFVIVDDVAVHDTIAIDLENVKVSGTIADGVVFKIYFTEALMFNTKMLTGEEVEAILAHELGHILNVFITLGDYVWLNYYLTDGIDILLGTKKNKFKLEIFSDAAIKKLVPEEDRENFINDRNESNAKRVVLSLAKNSPRHHLTNNSILANRREEQMADLFSTRLGYGRAFASGQYKLDKYFGDFNGSNWVGETLKVACQIVALPLVVMVALMEPAVSSGKEARYDDSLLRITRIRRDLVQQIKGAPPEIKDSLVHDIEAIDLILKEYSSHRTFYDELVTFFRPSIRKMEQNTLMENDLETLFNNDLFVQAAKLSKL